MTVRDDEVDVDGGTVRNAERAHGSEADRNKVWSVTIAPDGQDDVVITVKRPSATVPASAPPPPDPPAAAVDGATLSGLPEAHAATHSR